MAAIVQTALVMLLHIQEKLGGKTERERDRVGQRKEENEETNEKGEGEKASEGRVIPTKYNNNC